MSATADPLAATPVPYVMLVCDGLALTEARQFAVPLSTTWSTVGYTSNPLVTLSAISPAGVDHRPMRPSG